MAEYKRLITYAYSYESGIKKHNVGHARVEVYGSELKVKVNIKAPSYSEKVLKVYFYKRTRGGLNTSYFCDVRVPNGCVDEKFQTKMDNLGDSSLQFHELDGFVLFLNPTKCIVFDLKDQVLTNEEIHSIEPVEIQVEGPKDVSLGSSLSDLDQEKEMKEITLELNNDNVTLGEDKELKNRTELAENAESGEIKVHDNNARLIDNAEEKETEVYDNDSESIVNLEGEADADYDNTGIVKADDPTIKSEGDTNSFSDFKEIEPDVAAANAEVIESNQGIFANVNETEGLKQEVPFPWRDSPEARRILTGFPRVYPFEDGEIAECVKIEPKDIGLLPIGHWGAGNNSFLLHGYNNYHHLLFAKKQTRNGCLYLLMVPGIYNAREKYMARLFGFEYFKCAKRRNLREGEFGYWYLTIQF